MSGGPKVRSLSMADSEARPVLGSGGNKARSVALARKQASKSSRKAESAEFAPAGEEDETCPTTDLRPLTSYLSAPPTLRRHEFLLHSNLSLNASCSSDASTDSFCSRASTGRIGRMSMMGKRKQMILKPDKISAKIEKVVSEDSPMALQELVNGKRKCAWVTSNTEPCYSAFHDEEWGVPVYDDKKLFELLVLSGALAELTWPVILSKRHIFREVFLDFNPLAVSKLNEKKIVATGSAACSLLSESKLRATIENARAILKIIDEFGSFKRYCWSFVSYKPIMSRFRYPRQVPVRTPKAEVISKDLVRRGFRSVGPTVIYSFMQAAGLTNDHLISCFRFQECIATAAASSSIEDNADGAIANHNANAGEQANTSQELMVSIDLELSRAVDGMIIA